MNADRLLALYEKVAETPDTVARLRRFVLDLAVRGKLVAQEAGDEPARIKQEFKSGDLPFDVPANWRWMRVGDQLDLLNGMAFKPTDWVSSGLRIVRIQNLNNPAAPFNCCRPEMARDRSLIEDGSFLISWSGTPGTSFGAFIWDRGPAVLNQHIFRCDFKTDFFDPGFLRLAINGRLDEMIAKAHGGVGLQHITKGKLEAMLLPLPPLAEQRRIVAKVEELMALLVRLEAARQQREATRDRLTAASLARLTAPDTTPENFPTHARFALATLPALTKRPDQIKPLRQTILNLAVRGKLVDQDPSDEPASFERRKIESEPPFDAPSGWQWVPFSAVAAFENGDRSKKYPKRGEYVATGVPWINTGHIEPDGALSRSTMHYITEEKFASLGGGKIRPGDLVYCLRGATFGKTAYVDPFEKGAIASSLMIIRPSGQIDRRYTFIYLTSPLGREQLRRFDNGTAQPNLSSASVKRYLIPLPPLAEQHRIVAKVDALMALCDRLEAALAQADTTRARLLEALLAEALDEGAQKLEAAE
ncbi:MAG: restriction endonuclease subunit S [Defluviicoccus sp.]